MLWRAAFLVACAVLSIVLFRYPYLQLLYNVCYAAALLGLIHFWSGTKDLLKPYQPVWKFLTVKAVVFSTFWQGVVISLVLRHEMEDARLLQTWMLCAEMLPAACAMWYAFPATQYINAVRNRQEGGIMMAVQNVGRVAMFTDVVTDLNHQVRASWFGLLRCFLLFENFPDSVRTDLVSRSSSHSIALTLVTRTWRLMCTMLNRQGSSGMQHTS